MSLTEREQEIVALLRRDPLIGSEAIATALGTTRPAVNVHLSNLGKKGVILGRGYVLSEQPGVVVVGGANMDVKARSARTARAPAPATRAPARWPPGGVGRNVAENLARLGTRTHLVAASAPTRLGDQVLAATSGGRRPRRARTPQRRAPPAPTPPCSTPTASWSSRSPTWRATDALAPDDVNAARDLVAGARAWWCSTATSPPPTLAFALDLAAAAGVRVVLEPVSVPKAAALAAPVDRGPAAVRDHAQPRRARRAHRPAGAGDRAQLARGRRPLHARGVEHVWVRLGERGSLLSSPGGARVSSTPCRPTSST